MDRTISNAADLQRALQSLNTNSNSPNIKDEERYTNQNSTIQAQQNFNTQHHEEDTPSKLSSSKARTTSIQYSTTQLLHNLGGLQTDNNRKIDLVNDSIIRMNRCLEAVLAEQQKQTELLATIARNTAYSMSASLTPTNTGSSSKFSKLAVKDYGFNNPQDVVSELLIKVLKEVEIQVKNRGIKYRSSRTLTRSIMNQAVKIACVAEFKSPNVANKPIKLPENKDNATIYVASRIGTTDNVNPILTAQAIRELFDDPECRTFMSGVEEIVERLTIIKVVLPYYEADMISSITYPYFDREGEVICDWSKLSSRSETEDESIVISLPAREREKVAKMIAKGLPLKTVLRAVTKQ